MYFLDFENPLGVFDGGIDLQAVTNDPWIVEEPEPIFLAISRHRLEVEVVIGPAKPLLFLQMLTG